MLTQLKVLAVMYHYIRPREELPYTSCPIEQFKNQVRCIKKKYPIISVQEVLEGKNGCILTFDDGIKDHYSNVFPVLTEEEVPGVFFPITKCLQKKVVLSVQKAQFLLASCGSDKFVKDWNEIASDENKIDLLKIKANSAYPLGDEKERKIKSILSVLPNRVKDPILSEMFNFSFGRESIFAKNLYLNSREIQEMEKGGMEFGIHTHTHENLKEISYDLQRFEIMQSKSIIEGIVRKPVASIAYPYGGYEEKTTLPLLKNLQIKLGFTTKSGINFRRSNPLTLKRFDTVEINIP